MALVRNTTELDEYARYVGQEAVERVRRKAKEHSDLHVAHVSSTYYGGAVADVLSSLTALMNKQAVKTGWRTIQGAPDFFSVTKKFQNGLQGEQINASDLMAVSLDEYRRPLDIPQATIRPAIDPFTIKNRKLTEGEIQDRLDYYGIPTDLPIVTQISNFERRKNPEGATKAFRRAQKDVDATLVLPGNVALDDPKGENGLLVRSVEEAAENIVRLIKDAEPRKRLGAAARDSVKRNHLMIRLMEDYLDLFASFETEYHLPRENLERPRDWR